MKRTSIHIVCFLTLCLALSAKAGQISYDIPLPTDPEGHGNTLWILGGVSIQPAAMNTAISGNFPLGTTIYLFRNGGWNVVSIYIPGGGWYPDETLNTGELMFIAVERIPGTPITPMTITGQAVDTFWQKQIVGQQFNPLSSPHLQPFYASNDLIASTDFVCAWEGEFYGRYFAPNLCLTSEVGDTIWKWDVEYQMWVDRTRTGSGWAGSGHGPTIQIWEGFFSVPANSRTVYRWPDSGTTRANTICSPE